jgi:hypothetical protein
MACVVLGESCVGVVLCVCLQLYISSFPAVEGHYMDKNAYIVFKLEQRASLKMSPRALKMLAWSREP